MLLINGTKHGHSQCDPSTIDACEVGKNSVIQASFHAQIIKTSNGYSITGQDMAPSGNNIQVALTNVPSTTYPMPAGVLPIWGAIGGRTQAVFVASDSKIYAVGSEDLLIHNIHTNGSAWGVTTLSLPKGITICDINKWEGSAGSGNNTGNLSGFLAFSTYSGEMYITGNGGGDIILNAVNSSWTKIVMPSGVAVVDFAVGYQTLLILGADNSLYGSGPNTFLGNGTSKSLTTITLLTQPPISVNDIRQIEAGVNSFLVLDGDGTIHVLGENSEGSLGVGNILDVTTWSKVGSECSEGILNNVAYISTLSSHDNRSASSAILLDETIRSWGLNDNQSITSGIGRVITCYTRPPGNNSRAVAISNGGHISPYVNRQIEICNIGHNREGAFGDGRDESGDYGEYTCFNIPGLPEVCGTKETDLELRKTAIDTLHNIGDHVVFTITLTNKGPGASTGSSVRDQLPSGFRYISDDAKGDYNKLTGLWTVGPLKKGESISFKITASILSTGNYTNYAQVLSDNEVDPDSAPGDMSRNQDDDDAVTVMVIPCPFEASCITLQGISINDCHKIIPSIYDAGQANAEIEDIFSDIVTCGVVGIYHKDDFPKVDDCSIIRRTYWLTDDGKEVLSCFRDFTFEPDKNGPSINCPPDITLICDEAMPSAETFLTGIDDCSAANSFRVVEALDASLNADFCMNNNGITQRIYTTLDNCGNSTTCAQTITFQQEFYIPNIFSPKGSESNNSWIVTSSPSVFIKECSVYDRWGNVVFISKTEQIKWEGKFKGVACDEGVYVYVIYYTDVNGIEKMKAGEVALIN